MSNDIAYCTNSDCPFRDCKKHFSNLQGKSGIVTIADFGGTCRRYISFITEILDIAFHR